MNSVEIYDHFINRAKNLKEFTITTHVPDDFRFNGLVPFDLKINDGFIEAKVYGIEFEEACLKFDNWLETCK